MTKRRILASCLALTLLASAIALALAARGYAATPAPNEAYWGFAAANLDKTCKPCDDFFQFAMGGWMKRNPIPAEYSSWGTFTQLADKNQQNLRLVLDNAAKSQAKPAANEQKIGDFYAACMDTSAVEAAGTKPPEPELPRTPSPSAPNKTPRTAPKSSPPPPRADSDSPIATTTSAMTKNPSSFATPTSNTSPKCSNSSATPRKNPPPKLPPS